MDIRLLKIDDMSRCFYFFMYICSQHFKLQRGFSSPLTVRDRAWKIGQRVQTEEEDHNEIGSHLKRIAGNSGNTAAARWREIVLVCAPAAPIVHADDSALLAASASKHACEYQKVVRFARWIVSPRRALNRASLRVTQKESEFLLWFAIIAESKRECINILARGQPICN